jgi:orotate phosphoribosyltransferase
MEQSSADRAELRDLLLRCYCSVTVRNPEGQNRRGFFNMKRLLGDGLAFRRVIELVSPHIGGGVLCAPDHGSAPFVAALAFHLSLPALYIRTRPKDYYLSLGADHEGNHPYVFGERPSPGTPITIFDDAISSGAVIKNAILLLQQIEVRATAVCCLINVRSQNRALEEIASLGITRSRVFFQAAELRRG